MEQDLSSPFLLSFVTLAIILAVIPFLSEVKQATEHGDFQPLKNENQADEEEDFEFYPEASEPTHTAPLVPRPYETSFPIPKRERESGRNRGNMLDRFKQKASDLWLLFRGPAARFCLAAFFLKRVAFTSEGFMFQYASEKFGWELAQTTWLRVASALGAVFVTLVICPGLIWFFTTKREVSSHVLGLNIIRVAFVVLIISFVGSWLAWSGEVLAFGKLLEEF